MNTSDLESVLTPGVALREEEPGILSVYGAGERPGAYDQTGSAALYDLVMCNPLYNRVMWGYSVREYPDLVRPILESPKEGFVLDVACGSLAFTAGLYRESSKRPVILLDQSLNLLRKAKARLTKGRDGMPLNLVLLHGDAMELPFEPGCAADLISLNLLHCLGDIKAVVGQWKKVLAPGGGLAATTLIRGRRFGNGYLNAISKTDMMFSRDMNDLEKVFAEMEIPAELTLRGNLALIRNKG